jgi:hypothetical protein
MSSAVRTSFLRALGFGTDSTGPATVTRVPPSVVVPPRPATQQVNADALQDVEPTTLNIQNAYGSVTSVVWMSDPNLPPRLYDFHFSSQVNGGGFAAAQLMPAYPQSPDPFVNYADPALDANFSAGGVAPGRVYCSGIMYNLGLTKFAVLLWSSDNGGQSWGSPTLVAFENSGGSYTLDHPSVAVTQANGYVYVIYSRIKVGDPSLNEISLKGSADGGLTFGPAVPIVGLGGVVPTGKVRAPQIAADPSGTLYALWMEFPDLPRTPAIFVSRSATYGTTFESPISTMEGRAYFTPTADYLGGGDFPLTSSTLPMMRFNAANNSLAVVWHEREASPYTAFADVFYTSFDAATHSWSGVAAKLNSDGTGHDHFMPAVDADSSGNLLVDWYDRRNDSRDNLYELWSAKILPNGTRIGNDFPVTTFSTNPNAFKSYLNPNIGDAKFLGDYHQVFRFHDQSQWIDAFVAAPAGGNSDLWMGFVYY